MDVLILPDMDIQNYIYLDILWMYPRMPVLPPLDDLDEEITTITEVQTESYHSQITTIRGDGGYEVPVGPIEPEITESPTTTTTKLPTTITTPTTTAPTTTTAAPIQTIEPEKEETSYPRGPIGTLRPKTTPAPKKGCALQLNPKADDSSLDPNSFRFGTQKDGRLEYSNPRGMYRKGSDYHLEFKTGESDGILFYISDRSLTHGSYMSLFLQDGYLIFTYTNGSRPAIIKSAERCNDDNWHLVEFSREGSNGKLVVDRKSKTSGTAPTEKLELSMPFYIGGIDPLDYNTVYGNLNTTAQFKGCTRNFHMNGKLMTNPKKYGVVPCSDNVEFGTFFYGTKSSYVRLREKFYVGQSFNVKLDIKPRLDTGILMSVHGKKDYFILEMVNGSMKLTAENGLGPITAIFEPKIPYYFCDGNWHNIQAVKSKNVITLSVDNVFTNPKLGDHRAISTSTGGTLFLGGHRFLGNVKRLRGLSTNQAYAGCIKNVYLNDDPVALTIAMAHGNVIVGSCRTN